MRFTMRDGKTTLGYGIITELLEDANIEELDVQRKSDRKARKKALEEAENQCN